MTLCLPLHAGAGFDLEEETEAALQDGAELPWPLSWKSVHDSRPLFENRISMSA